MHDILLLYMNYPKQIYAGGAGEGGGFLKACCRLITETLPVFVGMLSRSSLAADATATNQLRYVDDDAIATK